MGQKVIWVDFYHERRWLQQVELAVNVELKVGMLLSVGGLGDKSFNDSAYQGLKLAREQYGIEFEVGDSKTLEDNVALLQQWAKEDYGLIIAIGDDNREAIAQVIESFPSKYFAIIDGKVEGDNVWSAEFQEFEADYLVGALAALVTGKDRKGSRIGFLGGAQTPIVRRIELAFWQGVKDINPDAITLPAYVKEFDDEDKGRDRAEILYEMGADVIYQAAGRSGKGAIRAAQDLGKCIISTGGDHSYLAPTTVLTSRIKNVHKPVQDVIKAVSENCFEGGKTASYGVANEGLTLALIQPEVFKRLVPNKQEMQEIIARLTEINNAVAQGQVTIDFGELEEAKLDR